MPALVQAAGGLFKGLFPALSPPQFGVKDGKDNRSY